MTNVDHVLRDHGHRVTLPRRVVWDVLASADRHLTADQITEAAQRFDPGINRASVYRSLALFAEIGLARETSLGADNTAVRWELAHPDDHFHLICGVCGDVEHHVGDLVEQVRQHLSDGHGFRAEQVDLSVTGICASCALN